MLLHSISIPTVSSISNIGNARRTCDNARSSSMTPWPFQILDMYERHGIKQTFFYPAWCGQYPHLVDMILEGGHEIAHGYLHREPNKLKPEEELYWFDRQVKVIMKMTEEPRGWRARFVFKARWTT